MTRPPAISRSPTHEVFVSVAVRRGPDVLLVQEGKPDVRGRWNLPGGRLEPGESPRAGARREVREETGLHIEPGPLLRLFCHERWLRLVFLAETEDDEIVAGDDILAARWFDPVAIERLREGELEGPYVLRPVFNLLRGGATGLTTDRDALIDLVDAPCEAWGVAGAPLDNPPPR